MLPALGTTIGKKGQLNLPLGGPPLRFQVVDEYVDAGFYATSDKRPAFQRMFPVSNFRNLSKQFLMDN